MTPTSTKKASSVAAVSSKEKKNATGQKPTPSKTATRNTNSSKPAATKTTAAGKTPSPKSTAKSKPSVTSRTKITPVAPIVETVEFEEIGSASTATYNAGHIQQKTILQAIRDLSGMYLGGEGHDALMQAIIELIDNAVDEAAISTGTGTVRLELFDNYVVIKDEGRGIPVGVLGKNKDKITLNSVFLEGHTGGKFTHDAYTVSGGMHGTGAKAASAFADRLVVETNPSDRPDLTFKLIVESGGERHTLEAFKGRLSLGKINSVSDLLALYAKHPLDKSKPYKSGTSITFMPAAKLLKVDKIAIDVHKILERIKIVSAATAVKFMVNANGEKMVIHYKTPKEYLVDRFSSIEKNDILTLEIPEAKSNGDKAFSGTLYLSRYQVAEEENAAVQPITSVVNNIPVVEGKHITAVTKFILNELMRMMPKNKKINITMGNILNQGLVAFVILNGKGAAFSSQAKVNLIAPEQQFFVNMMEDSGIARKAAFRSFNGRLFDDILAELDKKALKKPVKRVFSKLANVRGNKVAMEERQLLIVEGDSAGGTVKMGRDPERQAVFALSGKIKNVYGIPASSALGKDSKDELLDLNDIIRSDQFGYICLLSDGDVDGAHIQVLLLTLLNEYYIELIKNKRVILISPPLYGIKTKSGLKYAIDDNELTEMTKGLDKQSYSLTRYKGLGEMSAEQMHDIIVTEFSRFARIIEDDKDSQASFNFLFNKEHADARKERFTANLVVKI